MDNTTTQQKSIVGKYLETRLQKQRNKLVRSAESIGKVQPNPEKLQIDNNSRTTNITANTKTKATTNITTLQSNTEPKSARVTVGKNQEAVASCKIEEEERGSSVMGGGFATPQSLQTAVVNSTATTASTAAVLEILQMHAKLLEKDETPSKEKTEKLKQLKKKDNEKTTKTSKDSKFAEKLRRSFRRSEHKSLEIKRPENIEALQDNKFTAGVRGFPLLHKNSQSIFSLHNLPGLGVSASGGHINRALLLDSPDESTPPEYAYQHLSSVATTNSSTSLESNFEFGEAHSSQSSISYWAWQQSNSSMGGEISTASSGGTGAVTVAAASTATSSSKNLREMSKDQTPIKKKTLEAQCSSKSDTQQASGSSHAPASRSCSITSESSSVKLTRLQNFLFKSSNESSKSFQGHSNEAFTASSHNSSSGEWENLGTMPPSSTSTAPEFYVGSFPEEDSVDCLTQPDAAPESGNYYHQYTLTSPNNPFLPEIIAHTYHSTYDDEQPPSSSQAQQQHFFSADEQFGPQYTGTGADAGVSGVGSGNHYRGTHSAQLPTPAYSRAGSQESTHSECGTSVSMMNTLAHAHAHTSASSSVSSSSPTPGRQKRKLFSLNSPTRQQFQHQQHNQTLLPSQSQSHSNAEQHAEQKQQQSQLMSSSTSPAEVGSKGSSHTISRNSLVRSLNPFLPASSVNFSTSATSTTATGVAQKRAPLKQMAITSPTGALTATTAAASDLNAKREEFLRATMKICLVVSPPTSKLQLKSKSLTHLDGLDSTVACQHSIGNTTSAATANKTEANSRNEPETAKTTVGTGCTVTIPNSNAGAGLMGPPALGQKKKSSFMQRKKPLLTRSEVSSSEYFSVSFCVDSGCQDEEFIPAIKGVKLGAALSQALKRRNLSFSQITITDSNTTSSFLDAGYSVANNSLDENTDVENLAGRHLIVSDQDGSRKTLQKTASFGSRSRPPRLLSSASTEETTESAVPGKQIKQRWSGLFGVKNPQQSQLCELLNNYAKSGVPQKSSTLNFDNPNLDAALEYLDNMHQSWKDFVQSENMTDSEIKIQTAIWELVTTEVLYIHALQTVTDLFLACLEAVQEERLLTDVDQNRLFSNVRDICEANIKFWTFYLYPMVAYSVNTREPMRTALFQQGFIVFATIFAPYKKYCAEQSTCQFYCKELNRSNPLFTSYLAWCESQKMCNRLRLADILVRPMQRLTKYSLLLAAIKKHISDVEEIEAIDTMIHTVENFVSCVDNHLTTRQENERLKGVMARLESYDVVDTNNEILDKMVKQFSQIFDLCSPMKGCPAHHVRHLFMEGDHKFKDNLGKVDVHCFLLTDMLLVCKTVAKKGLGALKIIRQPYLTDRLVVHITNNILNCVYLNEFHVVVTAFTLQCSEAKNWYESLKRAKMIYTKLKGTTNWDSFRFGGSAASGGTADSLTVRKSPMNSSICSHVSSANNSHSGSVEWNDSRNISMEYEKTNSLSSDEGSSLLGQGYASKNKTTTPNPSKLKINTSSANTLTVQPLNHLGQSLPNLNLHHSHTNLYHTYSNNTLLVPGTTSSHSGNSLLSPSHRGISYPPPSPTRVPLRRGMAFTTSTKNPPLVKTRNITSQNSINWHQIPATPTPPSPQSQQNSPHSTAIAANAAAATKVSFVDNTNSSVLMQIPTSSATAPKTTSNDSNITDRNVVNVMDASSANQTVVIDQNTPQSSHCQSSTSTETDV